MQRAITSKKTMISIITPVYNAEKFISSMIDSVLVQTYQDWELILVDDGSKDASAEICKEYAAKDTRIRVIHQHNRGPAQARNRALRESKGDFITFADSDDWLEPTFLERLFQTLTQENADCVICEFFENDTQKEIVRGSNTGTIEHRTQEEMLYALYDFKIESYLWTMLFRRKCISTPFYPFKIVEDYATISSWMLQVKKAVFLHVPLYHYRQTKGSSSHVTHQEDDIYWLKAMFVVYRNITKHHLLQQHTNEINRYFIERTMWYTRSLVRTLHSAPACIHYLKLIALQLRKMQTPREWKPGRKQYFRYWLLRNMPWLYYHIISSTKSKNVVDRNANQTLFE